MAAGLAIAIPPLAFSRRGHWSFRAAVTYVPRGADPTMARGKRGVRLVVRVRLARADGH